MTCEVVEFVQKHQFSHFHHFASKFVKKKNNKRIRANLKSKTNERNSRHNFQSSLTFFFVCVYSLSLSV